ncbi:MAG: hypothetical protein KAZ18_07930 [Acinetobacter sp.]|nr:hypothetical protein [Candidatus Methylopumilus sp.]MBP8006806.1 hypothetical protein [Acinetobacter sp.]
MTNLNQDNERTSLESRTALARILINIFRVFKISDVDATVLLGYSEKNNRLIKGYYAGNPVTNRADLLDRSSLLIRLHYSLCDLYDNDLKKCSIWLAIPQKRLGNLSAIEFMKQIGTAGMKQVVNWIEKVNGR